MDPGHTPRDDEPLPGGAGDGGSAVFPGHGVPVAEDVPDPDAPHRWPREMWDFALEATHHRLARLCPFCSDVYGTRMILQDVGSFNMPVQYNAEGFTITLRDGASESVVTWRPCGHTVTVDGRLFEPREDIPSCHV